MKHTRLRFLGAGVVMAAALVLAASSFVQWRTPAWGILIWGHRTDVFLGAVGLILLGSSILIFSAERRTRFVSMLAGLLLAASSLLFGLSFVEWYLRHPSRLHLRVAPQILDIGRERVEPGIGLRWSARPGRHRTKVPVMTIPLIRPDPALLAEDRGEVEFYVDEFGFANRSVPDSADIIVLGDSFTLVVDVPWEERWVTTVERTTGLTVYNISQGGYCPSQEVGLYARYGDIRGVRLVLLGLYGINDLGGERSFSRFMGSGLDPREWAYEKARTLLPQPTFGFLQAVERWWADHGASLKKSVQLEPITVTNTCPPTLVSYYPGEQLRAWQCVYMEPAQSPGAQSIAANIARLAEMCRAQGRRAGVLYFPIKQTIHPPGPDDQEAWVEFLRQALPWIRPEGWDRDRTVMAGRLLLDGDRRLESYLATVCDSLGVLFHSTIPALEHEVQTSHALTYYRFDVHWNPRGNEAVGRDVAAWVDSIWDG